MPTAMGVILSIQPYLSYIALHVSIYFFDFRFTCTIKKIGQCHEHLLVYVDLIFIVNLTRSLLR
jgi:hypothetical protein